MNTAFVKIWDELVGAVAWDESRGLASATIKENKRKLFGFWKLKTACLLEKTTVDFKIL